LSKERYEQGDSKIPEVTRLIESGRGHLDEVLRGEGGWQKHADNMKAEAERYRSLSNEEKEIEALAESIGWTVEHTRLRYHDKPAMVRFLAEARYP